MRRDRIFWLIALLATLIVTVTLAYAVLTGYNKNADITNNLNTAYPYQYEIRTLPMSIDEAADNVRAFNHTPKADVQYMGNRSTYYGSIYEFKSGDASFSVNPMTGQVTSIYTNSPSGNNVTISMDKALAAAISYAREHYRGFSSLNMSLTGMQLNDHGFNKDYAFTWNEFVNDVQTLNYVNIRVDSDSCAILSYYGLALPVPVPLKSTISKEQAVMFALSKLGTYSADDVRSCLASGTPFNITFTINQSIMGDLSPADNSSNTTVTNISASQRLIFDDNHTQRQVWYVIVDEMHLIVVHVYGEGYQPAMDGHRWWISVDACTGEIVNIARCF